MEKTLDQLLEYNQENAMQVAERLRCLIDTDKTQVGIIKDISEWTSKSERFNKRSIKIDSGRFSKFVNHTKKKSNEWDVLPDIQYKATVAYLFENGHWTPSKLINRIKNIEDHLYHSLINYMEVHTDTEINMRNRVPGIYRVYRRSSVVPNKYLIGLSNIYYDVNSLAICSKEIFKYGGDSEERKIKFRPLTDEYNGYLSRKNKKYFIIAKDKSCSSLRITLLTDIFREEKKVTTMGGVVAGLLGQHSFATPVFYERFEEEESVLYDMLGVYEREMLPDIVLAYLDRDITQPIKMPVKH